MAAEYWSVLVVVLLGVTFSFPLLSGAAASRNHDFSLKPRPSGRNHDSSLTQRHSGDDDGLCLECMFTPTLNESVDFGRLTIPRPPWKVFRTTNTTDIATLLRVASSVGAYCGTTVAPNGMKHSTSCQACSGDPNHGFVLDMLSLPRRITVDKSRRYVDADGGAMWVEVLRETLRHGLSPKSWTDYLYLTVGGTLSVAGISGQAFKYGPQISNVVEMDVVTGKGDMVTCSPEKYPDLFYGVLGGMGQFGVITRARIPLDDAAAMVRKVEIPYTDFGIFSNDQQLLITTPEPDYVEGNVQVDNSTSTTYTLELAFYYTPGRGEDVSKRVDRALSRLNPCRGSEKISDTTYFDFLNRVKAEEDTLRKLGLWDVPHPWLNVFVPVSNIGKFMDVVLDTVAAKPVNGPFLVYPFFTDKWDPKASAMLPTSDRSTAAGVVVYVVSLLRSAPSCTPGSRCVEEILALNNKVVDAAVGGMGAKLYLAGWRGYKEWSEHFGEKWDRIKQLKDKYDPKHVLAPGLHMFKRIH